MSKKKLSNSQRFSRDARLRKKRKENRMTKKDLHKKRNKERIQKEKRMRNQIELIIKEGNKSGISYKNTKKGVNERTLENNISAISSLMKKLKIYELEDFNREKTMDYLEREKEKYHDGDIRKSGSINNTIVALKRFKDSILVSENIKKEHLTKLKKETKFINDLDRWKKTNKVLRSKKGSGYMKPSIRENKLINSRFNYLVKSRPKKKDVKLAREYHKFASITGARIDQGVKATLNNLFKVDDETYLYIVARGECKTGKPRIKEIVNKNDIKYLDELVIEVNKRNGKNGNGYIFEMKNGSGNDVSRSAIKSGIQKVYRENFSKYNKDVSVKVRGLKGDFNVVQSFSPHSSRSISIQNEMKSRALRYKRSENDFDKDLNFMVKHDNSIESFKRDPRGSIIWGYENMKKRLKRELTIKEKAMYLASVGAGHNRIDVMRDHYFSDELNEWFKEKRIK